MPTGLESRFAALLRELVQPGVLPGATGSNTATELRQTHLSAVLLTTDRAYKLKKPKSFGFCDYSTVARRRHYCEQEVRLNSRLAPWVYLGVAPIVQMADGHLRIGAARAPGHLPVASAHSDGGRVVDYAVVMHRLPDGAMLAARVRTSTASPALLARVAEVVAAFHAGSHTDAKVERFGDLDVIRANWEENFAQMRPYVGDILDAATFGQVEHYVHRFLAARVALLEQRVRARRIRDCHGDLRLEHVYALGPAADPGERVAIIDCIEFNDRFRYGDVASEVAFLAMELDTAGRPDLARDFVDAYVCQTGDDELRELLPFYACYRACVRAKVAAFQRDEPEVPCEQREEACREAGALLALAGHYAAGPAQPMLVLIGGLMGTGKSGLAAMLSQRLGWPVVSSDVLRKRLAGLDPSQPQPDAFGIGIYDKAWTARTYAALCDEAAAVLRQGRSVLLDATWIRRADRQSAVRVAAAAGVSCVYLECTCAREVALARLAARWATHVAEVAGSARAVSAASDGRPALYDAQDATCEAFLAAEEPGVHHAVIQTDQPPAATVEAALDALGIPQLDCPLAGALAAGPP
jgi:aminoglycoside phosphotransferase family enzyme/predicted kinase